MACTISMTPNLICSLNQQCCALKAVRILKQASICHAFHLYNHCLCAESQMITNRCEGFLSTLWFHHSSKPASSWLLLAVNSAMDWDHGLHSDCLWSSIIKLLPHNSVCGLQEGYNQQVTLLLLYLPVYNARLFWTAL